MSQENPIQSINAAYDSINLINQLNALVSRTEEEDATILRNVDHLKCMMTISWFTEALTEEQTTEINSFCI